MVGKRLAVRDMVWMGVFAACIGVLSQVAIPVQPVPVNLALLAVFVAAGVLGAWKGAGSVLVYLALGAMGVPVFAGFSGGIGRLVGPTGGYLVGYALAALVAGWGWQAWGGRYWASACGMGLGLAGCYALGTAWFVTVTGTPFGAALGMCVLPFIPGDVAKIAVAVLVSRRLRRMYVGGGGRNGQ